MRKLILGVVLGVLAVIGWQQRALILSWIGRAPAAAEPVMASPELAEIADGKLKQLAAGDADSIKLSESEIQSLLSYRFLQLLPAFVDSPRVDLEDGKINLQARVPVDQLPELSGLGDAASFLPDTTELGLSGRLLPLSEGRVAFAIDNVNAASIPLPDRLVPRALRKLGRRDEAGLPRNALALPLPPGSVSAHVSGDTLVLVGRSNQTAGH